MRDDEIQRALAELPRHRASGDFEPELMARLDQPSQPEGRPMRLAFATAAMMLAIVGAGVVGHVADSRREETRIQALRAEQEAIRAELEELKRVTSEVEPVVFIDGADGVGLVIDMTPRETITPVKQSLPGASEQRRLR